MLFSALRRAPIQRTVARITSFAFVWSSVISSPTRLPAQTAPNAHPVARVVAASAIKPKLIPPPASLRENLRPLTRAQVARLKAGKHALPANLLSLLDEVGRLNRFVSDSQFASWQQQIKALALKPAAAARLRLKLGEVELAKYQQPERAIAQFEKVQKLAGAKSQFGGLARYNAAVALFYEGAYQPSAAAFRALLQDRHPSPGFDRRQSARWLNHARACAGYHALREKAGIREPDKLDPLCGAEAIAVTLRSLKRPFDRKTVLSKVRVTGEGSNLQDLFDGGKKLGLAPHVVTCGAEGLKMLPMPLVAAVEHDHFVSVYRADEKGVTYLCSDCGTWPGGQRFVTWKQ